MPFLSRSRRLVALLLVTAAFADIGAAQAVPACRPAASFDGQNDYLSIPHAPELQNPTALTVELWVLRAADGTHIVLDKFSAGGSAHSYFIRVESDGSPFFGVALDDAGRVNNFPHRGSEAIPVGQWAHLAFTFDSRAGELNYFLNGIRTARLTQTFGRSLVGVTLAQTQGNVTVGAQPAFSSGYFHGHIDQVRIWNTARSEADLQRDMYAELGATPGLVAEYLLNTDFRNNAGTSHHASANGGVALSTGCATTAKDCSAYLTLNGTANQVRVPRSADLARLRNPNAITFEAWARPNPGGRGRVLSMGDGFSTASDRSYDLGIENGQVAAWCFLGPRGSGSAIAAYSALRIPDATWSHLAATYDAASGVLELFVNGMLAGRGATTPGQTLRQSTFPLDIGATPPFSNQYFDGAVDEVRVWSVRRTEQEIRAAMGDRLSSAGTAAEAVFHFDGNVLEDDGRFAAEAVGAIGYVGGCATSLTYGQATPGSYGTPSFTVDPLVQGQTAQLRYGNTYPFQTATGVIAIGFAPTSIALFGGAATLLTLPTVDIPVAIPPSGGTTPLPVSSQPSVAGLSLFMQCIQLDPGVPLQLAFSRGVAATIGS